jgi:hypothetical protein
MKFEVNRKARNETGPEAERETSYQSQLEKVGHTMNNEDSFIVQHLVLSSCQ